MNLKYKIAGAVAGVAAVAAATVVALGGGTGVTTYQLATLGTGCLWAQSGTTKLTITFPYADHWEFLNDSGSSRQLKWKGGSYYATNYFPLGNGQWLRFAQTAPENATFTTCNGTAVLTVIPT